MSASKTMVKDDTQPGLWRCVFCKRTTQMLLKNDEPDTVSPPGECYFCVVVESDRTHMTIEENRERYRAGHGVQIKIDPPVMLPLAPRMMFTPSRDVVLADVPNTPEGEEPE